MQAPAPAPIPVTPPVAQAPLPPGGPAAGYRFTIPRTTRQLEALRNLRSELSSQVISVRERRSQLARQYEAASGANRAGLESQLEVLDQRIVQIESDIAESGRILTSPEVAMLTTSTSPPEFFGRMDRGAVQGMSVVFSLFVLAPLAFAAARLMWRRASRPAIPPGWNDSTHRLERLEQAVDAIAIEIERVSEGQRFMTRILTQRPNASEASSGAGAEAAPALNGHGQPLALGPGSPDQVFVPKKQEESQRVRRG